MWSRRVGGFRGLVRVWVEVMAWIVWMARSELLELELP